MALALPLFPFDPTSACGEECSNCCLPASLSPTIAGESPTAVGCPAVPCFASPFHLIKNIKNGIKVVHASCTPPLPHCLPRAPVVWSLTIIRHMQAGRAGWLGVQQQKRQRRQRHRPGQHRSSRRQLDDARWCMCCQPLLRRDQHRRLVRYGASQPSLDHYALIHPSEPHVVTHWTCNAHNNTLCLLPNTVSPLLRCQAEAHDQERIRMVDQLQRPMCGAAGQIWCAPACWLSGCT